MQKEQFDITGMTCSACSTRVEKSVAKLPGIKEVSVNLLKNSMVASYDESVLDTAGIVQAVEKAGYGAIPKASAQNKSRTTTPAAKPEVSTAQAEYKQMKQRLLLSALFTIPLFYISMGHMMGWPLPSSLLGMPCVCGGSRRSIRPIQNGIQSLCMNKQRLNKNEKEQFTWKKY